MRGKSWYLSLSRMNAGELDDSDSAGLPRGPFTVAEAVSSRIPYGNITPSEPHRDNTAPVCPHKDGPICVCICDCNSVFKNWAEPGGHATSTKPSSKDPSLGSFFLSLVSTTVKLYLAASFDDGPHSDVVATDALRICGREGTRTGTSSLTTASHSNWK